MTSDTQRLGDTVAWSLMDVIWSVAYVLIVSVTMLVINWRLALVVLAVVPIIAFVAAYFQKKILTSYREVRKINSKITGAFNEGIMGAKATKTLVRENANAKEFTQITEIMAVPGTVLGVGYIRGYANGLFGSGILQGLYGTGAILVIVFVVRSLPVGTRSGISALRQIDRSIEESAYDMGANSGKVFMTVTLPLIKDSFFSGLVTTFVRSITAISAIILLVTPKYLLITTQINEFAEKGKFGEACAYATILIVIVYASILLMNLFIKYFGTSKKIREAEKNG